MTEAPDGDHLVRVLATLSNPHRMRVVATLARGRAYVSALARELGISRALLQLHLKKLESAGLVSAQLELSADGKAMKYYQVTPFAFRLTPETIAAAARTLSTPGTEGDPAGSTDETRTLSTPGTEGDPAGSTNEKGMTP